MDNKRRPLEEQAKISNGRARREEWKNARRQAWKISRTVMVVVDIRAKTLGRDGPGA
jgi:hypothetical protein